MPHESACRVLVGLLEARTGQTLSPNRIWRIETALKPIMRARKLADLDALVGALLACEDRSLVNEVVDAMLNNESFFFRDHALFTELNTQVLEDVRRTNATSRTLSIWMAGCSTGQEAYSIAMMLTEAAHKWRGWTIRLVGTDISHSAVDRAKAGLYTQFEIQRGLSVTMMVRNFDQTPAGWQIKDELRSRVEFLKHNLLTQPPPRGPFDIVLCRNVLLYFTHPLRRDAFAKLKEQLAPSGLLMLGAGETTLGQTDDFVASPRFRGFYERSDAQQRKAVPRVAAAR